MSVILGNKTSLNSPSSGDLLVGNKSEKLTAKFANGDERLLALLSTALTSGRIVIVDANGQLGDDANLTWDAANKRIAQESWTALPLTNDWVNYGSSPYAPAQYYKDTNGVVHLRGIIKSGTAVQICTALPADYRPEYHQGYIVENNFGSARLYVRNTGVIELSGTYSNTFVELNGIHWRTA